MSSRAVDNDVLIENELKEETDDKKEMISVITTVRNFEDSVKELYESLSATMKQNGKDFEIIFVDDGSEDATYSILSEIENRDPRIKLIKMRTSFGEASSLDAGLKHAVGDIIVYMTGRVRVSARGVLDLLQKLSASYDMVIGWRSPRADSLFNQMISKIFNWLARRFSGLKLHDMNSGIFVAKRDVFENVPIYGSFNQFLPMLASRQGYKITEMKIIQLKGSFRQSKYLNEYIQRLLDILTVMFLTKFSKKPIHFLGFVGTLFSIVGLGINLYLFIYRIFGFGPIAGRPLLLMGALFLVIGIQMISIGLIGEMIIFTHAKDIKEYNIEKILE